VKCVTLAKKWIFQNVSAQNSPGQVYGTLSLGLSSWLVRRQIEREGVEGKSERRGEGTWKNEPYIVKS